MTVYQDFNEYVRAVKNAYSNQWEEVFSILGISPKKSTVSSYTYYDGTSICHKEDTPSVQEFPESLFCHACDESMDILEIANRVNGMSVMDALKEFGERKGISYEPPKNGNYKKNNNYEKPYNKDVIQMVYNLFMKLTNQILFNSTAGKPFRDYLVSRGLNLEYLKNLEFEVKNKNNKRKIPAVGCVPLGQKSSLELKKMMFSVIQSSKIEGIQTLDDLEKLLHEAKLLNKNGNFKLMGRCVFSIVLQQRVVNLYGRKISDKDDFPKHLYLALENHGFYNFDEARKFDYVVFSESIIDALSLMQLGINTISTFGVGGWKPEICIKLLNSSKIKLVYFAFDKDKIAKIKSLEEYKHHTTMLKSLGPAGMKNAIKVAREIEQLSNIKCRMVDIPYDKDENGEDDKNDINSMVSKMLKQYSAEQIVSYFHQLMKKAQDCDTTELLLKLEIMNVNREYYTQLDCAEVVMEALDNFHVINAGRVIKLVASKYQLPFELLLNYQLLLRGQNKSHSHTS